MPATKRARSSDETGVPAKRQHLNDDESNKENIPPVDSPARNTRSHTRGDSLVSTHGMEIATPPVKKRRGPPKMRAPGKNTASIKARAPPKKTTPVKRTMPAKKTTPVKKTASAKKTTPAKKSTPAKNAKGSTKKLTRPARDLAVEKLKYSEVFLDAVYVPPEEQHGRLHRASEGNEAPTVMPEVAIQLAEQYSKEFLKRDPDVFDMYIYNRYPAWGLQQIIENHLVKFEKISGLRQDPDYVFGLWIILSGFAHWIGLHHQNIYWQWFQLDDSDLWRDTAGMIGILIITTLNIMEREGLLQHKDSDFSPIKDLGVVCTLLGEFVEACIDLTDEVPCLDDNQDEASWPYIFADYIKRHGIPIGKMGKKFFQKYDDDEKRTWKPRAGIDRFG